ncbi:hypothetical protein LDENG_00010690, partial [Lucifuga dentata]
VSNLDVESKLTTHYWSSWHQQRNIFHPSTRPACVEELHRQAKLSLWALRRDQQRRRSGSRERRVTISISAVPPMPMNPSPPHILQTPQKRDKHLSTFETTRSSSPTECCRFSPWSRKAVPSDPDTEGVALGHRSKIPIPNIPSTLDKQTNWSKALPLPTPEERMKSNSHLITSCVIPINVTGVGFDRDASVRCSLVHSQSLLQRRRKLRRRRTVAGIPRQVQQDLDSDDSPGSRERTVIVHTSADITPCDEDLASRLSTRDSGCQTEDFLISGAPSWRRIRAQRGQGASLCLSYSAGNISSLPDSTGAMFTASVDAHLRSRSLPRDGSRLRDSSRDDSDEEEELSPFDAEDFLPVPGELILKDKGESLDEQTMPERQLGSLKYQQHAESPEHGWMERSRSQLPRKADMGSCEISSSSDTFSSPIHSVSAAGGLGGQMDHKEDHQSSSGNWSGSSSTCPSQTSETIPPAASPPLTGSSHCDSELSLNAATHANDDQSSFILDMDRFQGLRTQRTGSFSSTAMDILEEAGISTPHDGEWSYSHLHPEPSPSQDFSPEPGREAESSLGCPSFTSMATCESSFSDKPPSEKADTVSHYSVDTEGYYTSMHFDCGLKESRSFTYNNYAAGGSDCGLSEFSGHMTLGRRCLSLRKVKDEGVVQSDYADLWLLNDLKSSDPYRSLSNSSTATGTTVIECIKSQESSDSQTSQSGSRATTPSLPSVEGEFKLTSPEKLAGLASPSSGYSSQSETPTSSFPSAFFPGPMSPSSGKRKPKVPERKSSLSSLSCRDGVLPSKRDLELPIIPPSHLDLSVLHNVSNKVSAHWTQMQNLHQSKQKALFARNTSQSNAEVFNSHPMSITPTVLHSVQLRSINKQNEGSHDDKTRPTCPTGTLSTSKSLELKSSTAYKSCNHTRSQETLESVFISKEEAADVGREAECQSETRIQQDEEGPLPLDGMTAFRFQCESSEQQLCYNTADISETTSCQEGETSQDSTKALLRSEDGSSPPESFQLQRAEPSDEESLSGSSSALQSSPERSDGLDEAPDEGCRAEMSQTSPISSNSSKELEYELPGVAAESAWRDSKEASTPDAEDDFNKDSTPSDAAMSLLNDETRPEDDGVFLSPTKSRTTEDLFAMIHRSKRKVLGRKDSNELGTRNRLGAASLSPGSSVSTVSSVSTISSVSTVSSPNSPAATATTATPAGLTKAPVPIYRNAKKSSTSNEEFKLLLLKKGSRSDNSYRMSATEILKSPVTPKSPGDSLTESPGHPEEAASPLQAPSGSDHLSSPYPKANAEGFSPKSFLTPASSRQGRSRIPPPANSSRYGVRSRLHSAPMQAISEGETENSDGSPHDDRSAQGST